jgi:toxin ParE1/3/4
MNVGWSAQAIDDLARLRRFISENDPSAAQRVVFYILHQIETVLRENPEIGRSRRVTGMRELIVTKTPFIVPYRVNDGTLEILRIYPTAQRWPEVF